MPDDVNWTEIQGNKFVVKPDKDMLGYINKYGKHRKVRNCSVVGETKFKKTRGDVKTVVYDEDYLIGYLESKLEAFLDLSYNDLQKLIKKARDNHKAKNKEEMYLDTGRNRQD